MPLIKNNNQCQLFQFLRLKMKINFDCQAPTNWSGIHPKKWVRRVHPSKKMGLYIQSNHAPGLSQAAPRPQHHATHDATHAAAHPSPWALTLCHRTPTPHTPVIHRPSVLPRRPPCPNTGKQVPSYHTNARTAVHLRPAAPRPRSTPPPETTR